MKTWLEFHDSTLTALTETKVGVTLDLTAYVHCWEASGESWLGTGWMQPVRILISGAGHGRPATDLPIDVADGRRRVGAITHDNFVPLPFSAVDSISLWNRHDDRVCDDDEASGKRSLFCALQKADREILGEYQHRNVALQKVRFAIQDATRDRQTEMAIRALRRFSLPHRLMDFNNLPETRFEDVKQVLRVASERIAARLEKSKP